MISQSQDSLIALETLDRTSPELWPEQIPGISSYAHLHSTIDKTNQPWHSKVVDKDDASLMLHLSNLSQKELVAQVKYLYDVAYNLGLDEAKEMTRGKYLNVLGRGKRS